jgi:DNA polymerase V
MGPEPIRTPINLHALVVSHPEATFFWRCAGAMAHAGIFDGDILVVDRAREARDGDVVVASHAGGYVIRRYRVEHGIDLLYAESGAEDLAPVADFEVWGVVIYSVHDPHRR